jgi:putative Holliday junction resolvase
MNLIYEDESFKIRGSAFEVYKQLGCGHKEVVYLRSMIEAMQDKGLKVEKERQLPVYFNEKKIGSYTPDVLVNDVIVIELKAKPFTSKQDIEQFWHYLTSAKYELGFLINFGKPGGVEITRRVYQTARTKDVPRPSALNSASFRVLGIDYGEKRIGLAISDESQTFARELAILSPKEFWEQLPNIISENQITIIVLGWPLNMSGEKTQKTEEVERFKIKVESETGLPVRIMDERLSSQMAENITGNKKDLDSLAAQILLQNYLDKMKN